MTGGLADKLTDVRETLGLTEGDLLLMTRLALFVEGLHDKIILNVWFQDELRGAGIRVYNVRSVDNLSMLFESDIVAALGLRIATLSDATSIPRAVSGNPITRGERAVSRLLREATAAGFDVLPVGLTRPDILCSSPLGGWLAGDLSEQDPAVPGGDVGSQLRSQVTRLRAPYAPQEHLIQRIRPGHNAAQECTPEP